MREHPSFFALEAHLAEPDASVRAHLEQCQVCSSHLTLVQRAVPMPEAIRAPRSAPRWWGWRFLPIPAVAAACALFVLNSNPRDQLRSTAKGGPAATVWIHRLERTVRWNGEPVEPGDTIRLEIAAGGFRHVTVFDERTSEVLYEAELSTERPTLTPSWQLDDEGGWESLQVVLDHQVGAPPRLSERCEVSRERWCQRFVLTRRKP